MHFPVLQSQTFTWNNKQKAGGGLTPRVWHLRNHFGLSPSQPLNLLAWVLLSEVYLTCPT